MLAVSLLLLLALTAASQAVRYEPTWESLDSRPLPTWYDEAKFGIFIHWGVFSVPSFGSEWFWNYWHGGSKKYVDFMKKNYPPSWTYADFAPQFTAEFYDPKTWAEIFKASGAKYIVLTSKHHEGFCNWPTNVSFNWNAMEVGPKRDLVGDLATAIRNYTDIHFGLYHSLFEWFNPLYLEDAANKFKTQKFVKGKTIPELYEIVNRYKPDVIWSDGCKGPDDYWTSKEFLAWLYNDSPVKDRVVTNDRWGDGCLCKHGGYYTCNDRFNPGHLLPHKWENCMTIDQHSWGYRREARLSDFLTTPKLISELASTVSCGGNLLMNVGPTHDGRIAPIFEERLRDMGAWLDVNGEAIYSSIPWTNQNDTLTKNVWYTSKKQSDGTVAAYAMLLDVPSPPSVVLGAPKVSKDTVITLLGYKTPLKWVAGPKGGVEVLVPALGESQMPTKWAWVLKMEGLMN